MGAAAVAFGTESNDGEKSSVVTGAAATTFGGADATGVSVPVGDDIPVGGAAFAAGFRAGGSKFRSPPPLTDGNARKRCV